MNNREWLLRTLEHEEVRKVPFNFMFSPPAQRALEYYYNTDNLEEALDFPIRMNAPVSIKPLYCDPAEYGETVRDEYGVVWSTSEIDRGSPIGHIGGDG